ncbi:MAG: hypothetical protein K0S24_2415 [Sphingobacterium sp.]|jgi:hypothetical protein|nr:hypothetical protein [Sphingobacterium sp.]
MILVLLFKIIHIITNLFTSGNPMAKAIDINRFISKLHLQHI